MDYLCVIQARLTSTRFPNKVMQMVGGKTMIRRVWDAAQASAVDKVIVAWPERWPYIEEMDLHRKFCLLAQEFRPKYIVRLTADCPLLTHQDINSAISEFEYSGEPYYNNRRDGYDVQIFTPAFMIAHPSKEHVIDDIPNMGGDSVNTVLDLQKVRLLAR